MLLNVLAASVVYIRVWYNTCLLKRKDWTSPIVMLTLPASVILLFPEWGVHPGTSPSPDSVFLILPPDCKPRISFSTSTLFYPFSVLYHPLHQILTSLLCIEFLYFFSLFGTTPCFRSFLQFQTTPLHVVASVMQSRHSISCFLLSTYYWQALWIIHRANLFSYVVLPYYPK